MGEEDFARINELAQREAWAADVRAGILRNADNWPQSHLNRFGLRELALPAEGGQWLRHGMVLAMVTGVAGAAVMGVLGWQIHWFGQAPEVVAVVGPYYALIAVSLVPTLLFQCLRQFAEALGRPWVPMLLMLAGVGLNVVLNWIFIYGKLGVPALGLTGAGWATLIARVAGVVAIYVWLARADEFRLAWPYGTGKAVRGWLEGLTRARFVTMAKIGVPAAAMLMFGATMMTAALMVFFRQAPPSAGATPRDLFLFNAAAQGVGILTGVVLLVRLARRAPRAGMGLSWRGAVLGALAFLAALPFVQAMGVGVRIAQTLASGVTVDPVAHNTLRVLLDDPSDRWGWGLAGIAVLGAPLAEEILFRGFLQSAFRGWLGGPWAAIGCSSLLFTLVHVGDATGMGAPGVAAIFVLSLGLGWSFERSRSIAAPIVMHMLFNAANVAMAVYFAQP